MNEAIYLLSFIGFFVGSFVLFIPSMFLSSFGLDGWFPLLISLTVLFGIYAGILFYFSRKPHKKTSL